jgi:hypothetical protein
LLLNLRTEKDVSFYINFPVVRVGRLHYDTIQFIKLDVSTLCKGGERVRCFLALGLGASANALPFPRDDPSSMGGQWAKTSTRDPCEGNLASAHHHNGSGGATTARTSGHRTRY